MDTGSGGVFMGDGEKPIAGAGEDPCDGCLGGPEGVQYMKQCNL